MKELKMKKNKLYTIIFGLIFNNRTFATNQMELWGYSNNQFFDVAQIDKGKKLLQFLNLIPQKSDKKNNHNAQAYKTQSKKLTDSRFPSATKHDVSEKNNHTSDTYKIQSESLILEISEKTATRDDLQKKLEELFSNNDNQELIKQTISELESINAEIERLEKMQNNTRSVLSNSNNKSDLQSLDDQIKQDEKMARGLYEQEKQKLEEARANQILAQQQKWPALWEKLIKYFQEMILIENWPEEERANCLNAFINPIMPDNDHARPRYNQNKWLESIIDQALFEKALEDNAEAIKAFIKDAFIQYTTRQSNSNDTNKKYNLNPIVFPAILIALEAGRLRILGFESLRIKKLNDYNIHYYPSKEGWKVIVSKSELSKEWNEEDVNNVHNNIELTNDGKRIFREPEELTTIEINSIERIPIQSQAYKEEEEDIQEELDYSIFVDTLFDIQDYPIQNSEELKSIIEKVSDFELWEVFLRINDEIPDTSFTNAGDRIAEIEKYDNLSGTVSILKKDQKKPILQLNLIGEKKPDTNSII